MTETEPARRANIGMRNDLKQPWGRLKSASGKEIGLREESVVETVVVVIEGCLGSPLVVSANADGFRPLRTKTDAARCIGATAKVIEVEVLGWGTAFEQSRMKTQLVLDLKARPDDLVMSALKQARPLIGFQLTQQSRARAAGLETPLDRSAFMETSRLSIDAVAAQALRDHLGCDDAVTAWASVQLGELHDARLRKSGRAIAEIHGFTIAVPFDLPSMTLATKARGWPSDGLWIGNHIAMTAAESETVNELVDRCERPLRKTALKGRSIVGAQEILTLPLPGLRVGSDRASSRTTKRWNISLESRPISFHEAFG